MRPIFSFIISLVTVFHVSYALAANIPVKPRGKALPPEEITTYFDALSKSIPSGELPNSFCFAKNLTTDPEQLEVYGTNVDSSIRLASVSKIITSLWAISVLGPQFRYRTDFSWNAKAKHLHIGGGQDPFMGLHTLLFLASEFDRIGIHDIELVTFDSNFLVYELADIRAGYESSIGSQSNPSPQLAQIALLKYFNYRQWPKNLVQVYKLLKEKAAGLRIGMQPIPRVMARNVILSDVDAVSGEPGAIQFSYHSAPLYKYLKHINTLSINYPSSIIFRSLGGEEAFKSFLHQGLGFAQESIKMHTGSGIEYYIDGESTHQQRIDNQSSCRTILKVYVALSNALAKSALNLADVLQVAGVDHGTWIGSKEVAGAVVAKTGTLIQIPVSNLTGMASTAEGAFYFGIFFQMKDLKDQNHGQLPKTRAAASSMVDVIVAKYGNKNSQPLAKQAEIFLPFDAALK